MSSLTQRPVQDAMRAVCAGIREWVRARPIGGLAALLSVLAAWVVLNNIDAGFYSGAHVPATYSLSGVAVVSIAALCLLAALAVSGKLVRTGHRPWLVYPATLLAASLATGISQWYVRDWLGLHFAFIETAANAGLRRLTTFVTGADTFILGAIAMLVYTRRRREIESLRSLAKMQLERQRLERDLLQSRLAAMQSVVEPQWLLDALASIRADYARNGSAAEMQLNELIDRLRARLNRATQAIESTHGCRHPSASVSMLQSRNGRGLTGWAT